MHQLRGLTRKGGIDMAKRQRGSRGRGPVGRPERRVVVHGDRRQPADLRKLSKVLLAFVQAQAEVEAEAEHRVKQPPKRGAA